MGFRNTTIRENQVRKCRTCGAEIFWWQNRNGKWLALPVHRDPHHSGPFYKHNGGAYSNLTPWHVCRPQRDFLGEQLCTQAAVLAHKIARCALDAYRANPDWEHDPLQLRLVAIQERLARRQQRRLNNLPEASRPYVR